MIYREHEILARVHYTGNKLLGVDENGEPDTDTEYYSGEHEDETLVWYEVPDMAQSVVDENGRTWHREGDDNLVDIDKVKHLIDLDIERFEKEEKGT